MGHYEEAEKLIKEIERTASPERMAKYAALLNAHALLAIVDAWRKPPIAGDDATGR